MLSLRSLRNEAECRMSGQCFGAAGGANGPLRENADMKKYVV